jgi:glycosyltransferase involved in cell wall biosynthesis
MRIVLSNASGKWGGVHKVTEVLARGLQARGHQVVTFARGGSILEQRMRGVTPVEPVLGGMDLHPLVFSRIARALRRHRPDVLVALMKKDVRQAVPVARMMRIPTLVRHANDQAIRPTPYHRFLYGHLPTHHVTNADATRRTLLASAPYLRESDISVIYNGIDPAPFDRAQPLDLGLPSGAIAVGYVGSLEPRKGMLDLARAWPRVTEGDPAAQLVIIGSGTQEPEIRAALADAERVVWVGHRKDVASAMKSLDLLVLPSHVEGAPNVVLEAMAAGVPVVATAVSGTPELVEEGVTGDLVPPRAPERLATALLALVRDAPRRGAMGRAARARVEREFRLDAMIDHYETLLERMSRRSGSRREPLSPTLPAAP